jgi:hypothetical protein
MKIYIVILATVVCIFSCKKVEQIIGPVIKEKPPVGPPEPPKRPPIIVLPDGAKNIKLLFNGDSLETTMTAAKSFSAERQPSGRYSDGFNISIRLENVEQNFRNVVITLPLNDSGLLSKGKFTVKNNEIIEGNGRNFNISYYQGPFFEDLGKVEVVDFKTQTDFWMNLGMEVVTYDTLAHTISGFIDSLIIVNKLDTTKKMIIRDAQFSVNYNHFEMSINDKDFLEADARDAPFYGVFGTNLFGAAVAPLYPVAVKDSNYYKDFSSSLFEFSGNYWTFEGNGTYIIKSPTLEDSYYHLKMNYPDYAAVWQPDTTAASDIKVVVESYLPNLAIKATLSTELKKIDQSNWPPIFFQDTVYKVKVSYGARKL